MIDIDIPQNYERYIQYAPIFLTSVATSFLLTPVIGFIARKLNILGFPPSMRKGKKKSDKRHLEKQPTPLLGGLAVIIPFIILTLSNTSPSHEITALLIAVGILAVMGMIDDRHELSGGVQLAVQILVAIFLAASIIDIPYVSNPLGGVIQLDQASIEGSLWGIDMRFLIPGDILLVAWIIICTVAVKISSGTDGLMEGNSFIASFLFFLLSIRYINEQIAIVSIIFAGLILGFLFFNFYPSKIWSGSTGKSTYGFVLAVLSVLSGAKLATAIMILLLPIADLFIVMIGRYREHKPKNPLKLLTISDQTHLHHKLLSLGLSERRVAFIEYIITATLGAVALALSGTYKAFLFLITAVFTSAFIMSLSYFIQKRSEPPPETPRDDRTPEAKYSY